jgi:hypothetical protein
MNRPEYRIPEDKAQEVFTLAAQLYAQHNQSYSVNELMEAGTEARIPPEFIQQAIEELQIQHSSSQKPVSMVQSKKFLVGLAIALPLLAAIAGMGWLLARNAATDAKVPPPVPQPISGQPPQSNVNAATGDFKCANLNLEGQDLRGKKIRDCHNAKLAGADLRGADLQGANLSHTDLKNAKVSGANVKGADLANADLANADLSNADLKGANLSHTDLRGANLSNANISGADMAGAQTKGANLNGTQK